jgi:hypothetical protein
MKHLLLPTAVTYRSELKDRAAVTNAATTGNAVYVALLVLQQAAARISSIGTIALAAEIVDSLERVALRRTDRCLREHGDRCDKGHADDGGSQEFHVYTFS